MMEKKGKNKEKKKRDYIAFFIVSFILIFLTSSFVIEDIYNSVDSITISPEGVQTIYETGIGAIASEEDTTSDEQETDKKDQQNTEKQDANNNAVPASEQPKDQK